MKPPFDPRSAPLQPGDDRIAGLPAQEKTDLIHQLLRDRSGLVEEIERERLRGSASRDRRLESGLAAIATHAWRARAKMLDGATAEPRAEMRRVYRHVESLFGALAELGLEVREHTGELFDYGSPLTVITTQPTPGLDRERVVETLKPTIYWNQVAIQTGEVVIATPVHP